MTLFFQFSSTQDLQNALDEETNANEEAYDQIKELKNKLKGIKVGYLFVFYEIRTETGMLLAKL